VCLVLADIALLIPAFALLLPPPVLAVWLLWRQERSPTIACMQAIPSFGTKLEPRYVVGATALDQ
jgi:hypothetical protein